MRILQINSVVNSGSTGRIAEDIGKVLLSLGHESYIAFGRGNRPSASKLIRIGSKWDTYQHGLVSLLFDRHGFSSRRATLNLLKEIDILKPDIIHIHNLHGYYIHIGILFNYLIEKRLPTVITLHDVWLLTGHCSYFELREGNCEKWVDGCFKCPKIGYYPKSLLVDNSYKNYLKKKNLVENFNKARIITPSMWLKNIVEKSILRNTSSICIPYGIDINKFKNISNKVILTSQDISKMQYILGVANKWDERKGFDDFIKLRQILNKEIKIVLVGLSKRKIKSLPPDVFGIERTESEEELANLYSGALCFINPTYRDNFPVTNLEALACGTPVITYDTGGSPEAIDESTGIVVSKGDITGLANAISKILSIDREVWRRNCRQRAEIFFDKEKQYREYIKLYEQLLDEGKS